MARRGAGFHAWAVAWTVCATGCTSSNPAPDREVDTGERVADAAAREPDMTAQRRSDVSRAPSRAAADGGSEPPSIEPDAAMVSGSDEDAGGEPQPEPKSEVEPHFSLSEPLEVSLELASADWDALRREGRSLPATISGCDDSAFQGYTDFIGQLRLSGTGAWFEVQVRKKGYIGSISMFRPSLVIEFSGGISVAGFKRLTLNNNREDPTNAHQCMAYELFARAGLPAPRCGLAHVTVNGENKGYFTHVEPIKKPFLRRVFGEDEGNLYELESPTDLSVSQADRIELKTNESAGDRSDLQRLLEVLSSAPDDQLLAALDPLIDLEEYLSYSAVEVLVGQWDGLSGHGTNAFLYHAVRDGRFHLIPWGADQAFTSLNALIGEGTLSVFASTVLGKRLHALAEWRARYRERLQKFLNTLWESALLLDQLQRIAQLTAASANAVAATERFIEQQREVLERELAQSERAPPRVLPVPGDCQPPSAARSSIELAWNATPREGDLTSLLLMSLQPVSGGNIDLDLRLRGQPVSFVPGIVLGAAGVSVEDQVLLATAGIDAMTLQTMVVALFMPRANYRQGMIEFHGYETYGLVVASSLAGQEILGYIGAGTIRFDSAGPNTGDRIAGEWSAAVASAATQ